MVTSAVHVEENGRRSGEKADESVADGSTFNEDNEENCNDNVDKEEELEVDDA